MPAPKDRSQLTAWLKSHGYRWVLQSPTGAIVSVPEAIRQIEENEQQDTMLEQEYDPYIIRRVYYSEHALYTGHVWMGEHDDDTGEFSFFMSDPTSIEDKDGTTRYTFADGVVLVQHDGVLETEWEWKGEPQPPPEKEDGEGYL